MQKDALSDSIRLYAQCEYARSGGPGGQNVNKVETKVRARVDLRKLLGLSEAERERAEHVLSSRMDSEGLVFVTAEEERSRGANEAIAIIKLIDLIAKAAKVPRRRIVTKPTRASCERRIRQKKTRSSTKQGRGKPAEDT